MKRSVIYISMMMIFLATDVAKPQMPSDSSMAAIQIQIKQAQEMVKQKMAGHSKEIQQAMVKGQVNATIAHQYDIHNVIPDSVARMTLMKMPDPAQTLNNVNANLNKNIANLQKLQAQVHQGVSIGIPKSNNASWSAIPGPSRPMIVTMAKMMLVQCIPKLKKLDITLPQTLDELLEDTTITPQAQALIERSKGAPLPVVQYLACKGVINEPHNPWSSNMLGLVYRDMGDNKSAIQCYLYAYALYPCPLIRCNLAWAMAYYGDFTSAKKYFNSVLSTLPDYASAWEGLGMMAYQQGDIAALFQCMAHQVKTAGAGGDDGPGDDLIRFCGNVQQEQSMASAGQPKSGGDPTQDNSLDPAQDEDGDNQDPPPSGDSEYPTFPSMGGMFAQNIEDLQNVYPRTPEFMAAITKQMKDSQSKVDGLMQSLSKLKESPYMDDEGMKVTPAKFSKFLNQFHGVEKLFEKRASYVFNNYFNENQRLILSMAAQGRAFNDFLVQVLKSEAGHNVGYADSITCEVIRPRARIDIGTNLSGASDIFTRYFVQMKNQIDWYIDASTPSIKRMLKPDWNKYMNAVRENDIRREVLIMYHEWVGIQAIAAVPQEAALAFGEVSCPITSLRDVNAGGSSAQGPKPPKDGDLKPYSTPPNKCPGGNMGSLHKDFDYLKIDADCNRTRIGVYPFVAGGSAGGSAGGFKASAKAEARLGLLYQHTAATSTQAAHDDYGTTANVNVDAKLTGDLAEKLGPASVTGHAGAQGSMNADFDSTWRYGADGSFIGKAKSADFDMSVKVDGKMAMDAPVIGEHDTGGSWMAEAHGKIDAISAGDSGYKVIDSSISASSSNQVNYH